MLLLLLACVFVFDQSETISQNELSTVIEEKSAEISDQVLQNGHFFPLIFRRLGPFGGSKASRAWFTVIHPADWAAERDLEPEPGQIALIVLRPGCHCLKKKN